MSAAKSDVPKEGGADGARPSLGGPTKLPQKPPIPVEAPKPLPFGSLLITATGRSGACLDFEPYSTGPLGPVGLQPLLDQILMSVPKQWKDFCAIILDLVASVSCINYAIATKRNM